MISKITEPAILPAEQETGLMPANQTAGINIETLLSKAIDNNVPVETMEKLLSMSRELKADYAREKFNIALAEFQAECTEIIKVKVVKGKDGRERYRYAPIEKIIEQIKPYLRNNGFSFTIKSEQTDKTFKSICEVRHIAGHVEYTTFEVPLDPKAYMSAPQKVGSASTYSKRYAFCNAFGIMTAESDDDGNVTLPDKKENVNTKDKHKNMHKIAEERAIKEILEMIEEDQKRYHALDKEHAEEIIARISTGRPYKGGWIALHAKLKEKFETEWVPY